MQQINFMREYRGKCSYTFLKVKVNFYKTLRTNNINFSKSHLIEYI